MPKTNSTLADEYIARLQNAIRHLNGCESKYLETVAISESFQGFQSQARIRAKREAQQRVVEMIMPEDTKIMMQHMGPDECLGGP